MGKGPKPNEQRIVLEKISWQKFESILAEMDARTSRFTYDRGRLEMMTPLDEHERCRKLIESLLLVLAEELKLPMEGYVAPTLMRPDLGKAVEPDACYYFRHAAALQGKAAPDLAVDPPPDLVQEVALNKSTLDKLSIYAALGVPEVWRYLSQPGEDFWSGELLIYRLDGDRYIRSRSSLAFSALSAAKVLEFIEQSDSMGLMTALRLLRAWTQEIR
ncbi:MAG TPA: Uma2 family endonuclease [Thermosynechococcaceae cyanobacterium]